MKKQNKFLDDLPKDDVTLRLLKIMGGEPHTGLYRHHTLLMALAEIQKLRHEIRSGLLIRPHRATAVIELFGYDHHGRASERTTLKTPRSNPYESVQWTRNTYYLPRTKPKKRNK